METGYQTRSVPKNRRKAGPLKETGYEPKNYVMEIFGRRKASLQELAQGEEEMKQEAERIRKERIGEFLEQEDASVARALTFEEEKLQIEGTEDEKGGAAMERILQEQVALQEQLIGRGVAKQEVGPGPAGSSDPAVLSGSPPPLFDESQLRRFRELELQAPLLLKKDTVTQRPTWMEDEEKRQLELEQSRERMKQQQMRSLLLKDEEKLLLNKRVQELEEERLKLQRMCDFNRLENEKIAEDNQKIAKENEDMRRLLRRLVKNEEQEGQEEVRGPEEELRFSTPEEEKKYLRQEGVEGKASSEKPVEDEENKTEAATPMDLMMKMMQTMQRMVEKSEGRKEGEGREDVEKVRSGIIEMPKLPEWSVESGPLDVLNGGT